MLAKLVRFYHRPYREFIEEMPKSLAEELFAAIPYLEAMEAMDSATACQFPHMTEEAKKKYWRRLSLPLEMLMPPATDHDRITILRRSMAGLKRKK